MRTAIHLAILTFVFLLLGCGGGGGGTVTETTVKFSVNWGQRSRAFGGPSSALSMVLRITGAGVPSGDFLYSVNRDADPSAHTANYTSGPKARAGNFTVTATFYADVNSGGDVVGVATGPMTVNKDGTLSGSISTVGSIASVQVVAGQSVGAGETKQLDFTTRDSGGGLIAVSPGSAVWSVVTGADKLAFEDGYAKGLIVGSATATATVDGVTSAAGSVSVSANPNISVAITPQAPVVLPNGTQQFSATVSGTSNQSVTWSVLTASGGTIDGGGLYSAPGTIMYATVEARSVADPSKAQTALVTVQAANLTVTVTPNPVTVSPGGTQQFTAVVDGSPNQNVTWSVVEAGGGSIDTGGLYTAPSDEGNYTVRATSLADSTVSGTSVVGVVAKEWFAFQTNSGSLPSLIWRMNIDGTGRIQLTSDIGQAGDRSPAVSPNGLKIAFNRRTQGSTGTGNIWIMNADGTGQTQLTTGDLDDEPTWSPDGTQIAFQRGTNPALFKMNANGTGVTQLTASGYNVQPSWSPDGLKIAFQSNRQPEHGDEIRVINADGTGDTRLTFAAGQDAYPSWTKGGRIVFQSEGRRGIYIMDADGGNQVELIPFGAFDYMYQTATSVDGSKIACEVSAGTDREIWLFNADGGGGENITNTAVESELHPSFRGSP